MSGKLTKVLITVKTYPTLSKKYDELVCTAGVLEDGSWIRLYPVPFRKLDYETRYKKYQWIELQLEKNTSDPRPESYRPTNIEKITLLDIIDGKDKWEKRKEIIIDKGRIFTNLTELKTKRGELSLATFKPSCIKKFLIEKTNREWPEDKLICLKNKAMQLSLFQTPEEVEKEFAVVKKLPYKFSYCFSDDKGEDATLMIEDWEIGELYWNCLKSSHGDEKIACQKVQQKYMDYLLTKDLYLFLGTTRQFHGWGSNPFLIIGVFYPPYGPLMKQPTFEF